MVRTILLKYGEIVLKGANKRYFENLLGEKIRYRLNREISGYTFEAMQSTVFITPDRDDEVESALKAVREIFGIVSLCVAYRCEKNMDDIISLCKQVMPKELSGYSTFKVDAKRSDKRFPLTTPQIMQVVGGALLEACPHIKVDVRDPQITVMVEIRDKYAFVHAGALKGAGGMPYGSNGKAMLLLSGGIDSPVAGYMIAKRGVEIEALHFESFPYTSERAKEKVISLAKILTRYTGKILFHTISLTEIQEAIRDNCDEDYFTLILRRFMMRLSTMTAKRNHCTALITGESIGQVASQTMGALAVTDEIPDMPVFRPLIGMDKEEIVVLSRKIDTFETSIMPYEDCCTVFTPRHPKTRPEREKVIAQENKLDIEGLTERAFATLDTIVIK